MRALLLALFVFVAGTISSAVARIVSTRVGYTVIRLIEYCRTVTAW